MNKADITSEMVLEECGKHHENCSNSGNFADK